MIFTFQVVSPLARRILSEPGAVWKGDRGRILSNESGHLLQNIWKEAINDCYFQDSHPNHGIKL